MGDVTRPAVPTVGWLIGGSLWMLPVLLGFGTTTWIGLALIGFMAGRITWILAGGIAFGALLILRIDAEEALYRIEAFLAGYVDLGRDAPLLVLYLVGVAFAVHVNRVWLRARWEKKTGSRTAPAGTYHRAPTAAVSARREPTRRDWEARALRAFRTVLEREESRLVRAVEAVATAPVVPASTPAPASTVPATTSSVLGIPLGPVDVRTASVDEIAAIPAIGPARAALIAASRGVRPLDSAEDVIELLDLPAADAIRVRPYLRF